MIYPIPEGITIVAPKPTEIVVTGIDKQKVGQVAAEIRSFRPQRTARHRGNPQTSNPVPVPRSTVLWPNLSLTRAKPVDAALLTAATGDGVAVAARRRRNHGRANGRLLLASIRRAAIYRPLVCIAVKLVRGGDAMTTRMLIGDCRQILATLDKSSVHCVVTSSPYFWLARLWRCRAARP